MYNTLTLVIMLSNRSLTLATSKNWNYAFDQHLPVPHGPASLSPGSDGQLSYSFWEMGFFWIWHISEIMQYLSFCSWLISLHKMSSGFICVGQSFSLLKWNGILWPYFPYPHIHWQTLRLLPYLTIVNNAEKYMRL